MGMKKLYDTGRMGFFKLRGEHDDFSLAQLNDFDRTFVSDDCVLKPKYKKLPKNTLYKLCL